MPPSSPRGSSSTDPLEAQACADLAAGRWRKARDGFKDLCKRDRAAFEPLLIEANIGLARAMLAKGLISDARQVLTYLKTIAPAASIKALESEIAAKAVDPSSKPTGKTATDLVAALTDNRLAPTDARHIADHLVVAFKDASVEAATPERALVVAGVRAIQQAIELACLGDHDAAMDLVRPIKRDSAFVHWRLFVRAIVAFQRGDFDKATQCFEELPADSAPGRAREAWLLVLGKRLGVDRGPEAEAVLEAVSALSGDAGWGRVLGRADALWRADKYHASYRAVRDAKGSFPSVGVDLSSALSDFYFRAIFALRGDHRDDYEDVLWEIEGTSRGRMLESMLARRTLSLVMALDADSDFDPRELRRVWEGFLQGYERVHGAHSRLASVAWAWLGEVLARPPQQWSFIGRRPKKHDQAPAIAALEKSVALDPANVSAHLILSSVYTTAKRTSDRNRLLDVMASRFPNDKEVLLAAGAGSLERKAFAKAVERYERALALDRLDPAIPERLVPACLGLAMQHYQKGRLPDGRRVLDRADELAVDSPDNFVRGRWCLIARRGVLETRYGDASLGAASLEEARVASPSPEASLLFIKLAWSYYSESGRRFAIFPKGMDRASKTQPNLHDAVALVRIWLYWADDPRSRGRLYSELEWLQRYLDRAVRKPFARDDATRLMQLMSTRPELGSAARALTDKVLKRDPRDPLFQLYADLLGAFPMFGLPQYQAILAEARHRGDTVAEKLAREAVNEMGMLGPPLVQPWDGRSDQEEMVGEDLDDFPALPPGVGESPDDLAGMADLLELLAHVPDFEIQRLRKRRPKGMPAALFDSLVAAARAGPGGSATPGAVPSSKRAPAPSPDQVDLF